MCFIILFIIFVAVVSVFFAILFIIFVAVVSVFFAILFLFLLYVLYDIVYYIL